jgi:YHS domain-containing protein
MDWNLQTTMARDPVCWMQVSTVDNPNTAEHDGETYYFCSRGCMLDFKDEPDRFLAPDYKPEGAHDMGGHDMGGHDMGGHDMGGHDMGGEA